MKWSVLFLSAQIIFFSPGLGAKQPPSSVWQVRQGKWKFLEGNEIECAGQGYSSLLFHRGAPQKNFDVSVEVMFLNENSSAGIIFRQEGKDFYHRDTFYQFEWYTTGSHHSQRLSLLTKNPPWRFKQIVTPLMRPAPLNRWIKFRVRAEGELIQCYIDEEKVFEVRDRSFVRKGAIALHSFMPTALKYRNFQLRELTTETTKQQQQPPAPKQE